MDKHKEVSISRIGRSVQAFIGLSIVAVLMPMFIAIFLSGTTIKHRNPNPNSQKFILLDIGSDDLALEREWLPPELIMAAFRYRPVKINPILNIPGEVKEGDWLLLNLFNDAIYMAIIDRIVENINGTLTVRGRIQDYLYGYVLLSTTDRRTLGLVCMLEKSELYIIQSDSHTGKHYLFEIDRSQLFELEDGPSLIPGLDNFYDNALAGLVSDFLAESTIDVMVIYTPAARQWANSSGGGIHNVIAQAMEKGQLALDKSDVGVNINLVHSGEVDYVESGDSPTDLRRLTYHAGFDPGGYDPDRYMDEIHGWRNSYRADLVALFAHVEDTGGYAWALRSASGWPDLGFSLTRIQQASWTYTHIHELGHNMGCDHRKDQVVEPGPGLFDYSAGWRWIGNDNGKYCSVMSYEDGGYSNVAHFSNPNVYHRGQPTGRYDADNARTIREVKHVIAAYRFAEVDRPPEISITSPPAGANLFGMVPIQVSASDDVGIKKVEFYINGKINKTDYESPYSYDWHTNTIFNGEYNLKAVVYDTINQTAQDEIAVIRVPHAPLGFTGTKHNNSSVLLEQYINVLTWRANGLNQNIFKYRIFLRFGEKWVLLDELDADKYEYWHMDVEKQKNYIYAIKAVDDGGREGELTYVGVK